MLKAVVSRPRTPETLAKLEAEIEKKQTAGYPLNNIIFEHTQTAILYQHGQRIIAADMCDSEKLAELAIEFFRYVEPQKVGRSGPWATSAADGRSIRTSGQPRAWLTYIGFDRNTYLRDLDRFYVAIEHAARTMIG